MPTKIPQITTLRSNDLTLSRFADQLVNKLNPFLLRVYEFMQPPIPIDAGGTGATSFVDYGVVVANSNDTQLLSIAPGTSGNVLTSNGTTWNSTAPVGPSYPTSIANGGTGTSAFTDYGVVVVNSNDTALLSVAPGTLNNVLTSNGTQWVSSSPASVTFPITVPQGGTGTTLLTANAVLLGEGAGVVAFAVPNTAAYALVSNGSGSDPSFQQINLTSGVTGILTVPNGGTGDTTLTAHAVLIGEGASAVAVASPGSAAYPLVSNGASADPSFQQLTAAALPTTTVLFNTVQWSPVDIMAAGGGAGGSFTTGSQFVARRTGTSVTGVRFAWGNPTTTYTVQCQLWSGNTSIGSATTSVTGVGIYTATFASAVALTSNAAYYVTCWEQSGAKYSSYGAGYVNQPTAPWYGGCYLDWLSLNNYGTGHAAPTSTAATERYPVEPIFQ